MLTIDLAGDASPASLSSVPELREGEQMELPERATLNPDGTVTLTFETAAAIVYRPVGGGDPRTESFDHLVLRRLKGAQLRKIIDAKAARGPDLALALSSGVSEAKLKLLYKVMEASDLVAARQVLDELVDITGEGLPAQAEQQPDGSIMLPLREPATDGDGVTHSELVFRKFKAEALVAMQTAKDLLGASLQHTTGLTPKAASGLVDDMDAADLRAAQRVVLFFSGIGRRTGG